VALAAALADLTEKEFSTQVYDLARSTGWHRYHTYRSTKSPAGFPDEVLTRERVVFLELKREAGKLSPAQQQWLGWLLTAGAEAYVVRPRDLDALGIVLGGRVVTPPISGRVAVAQEILAASTRAELPA
jgi:hypothetical protein